MYQWRKFEFFEEKAAGRGGAPAVPAEIAGRVTCCSGGRGRVVLGCDDGTVGLLDRGFRLSYGFQAYASSVLFLQQLKQRNVLVAVGDDGQASSQSSAICLKVFDLDKVQEEGSSTTTPFRVQILRIFTNQFPQAKITSFLVLEEAPPILLIALGLDNGSIYCIKGDIERERITRFQLQVDAVSDGTRSPITGLGFRVEGQAHQLFAITPSAITLFSLHHQPPRRQTLDQIGCQINAAAMSDRMDLIVGRPEAVYFYEVNSRGPYWAFDGEKKFVGWFQGYLLCVIGDQRSRKNTLNVYDLNNRLIAHSMPVGDVLHLVTEWGYIILIMSDKSILCIGEKDMESKLDMLFKKNLYTVAINLVQSQQADPASTAEVLRKYGDHLYGKQEYNEAMSQYIHTIGHLEPSYVIQKFLDAKRIYNLTNYLEKLHDRGLSSKDHTSLLLNCYTKLKDDEKLNHFIKDEDAVGEIKFDVETAIRVCRAAGYHEHAMFVAKKAGRHELYLKILLEDLARYEEALQYISSLEANQAGLTVKEYGNILVDHRPAQIVEILLRLCTDGGDRTARRGSNSMRLLMIPSPMDFVNIFVHSPQYLMEFLENCIKAVKDSPAQTEIHNTLLELYISKDLSFPSMSQENGFEEHNIKDIKDKETANGYKSGTWEKAKLANEDAKMAKDIVDRQKKGLALLKSAWTSEMEEPLYSVDLALIICNANTFKDGLLFLYEKLKLYKEVISCYKQAHDHEGLIACCKKLGDSSQGGDPSLWGDLLKYFGDLREDCSNEVKEVLTYIEKEDVFPPIVLQTLSKNPCLTLSVVKDYIARKLEQESKLIEDDRKSIDKYQEEDDRLSNLPDDVLLNIVERLDIANATRTSILSRRWKEIPSMLSKILIMVGSTNNVQERSCDDVARANATMLGATRSLLESRSTSPYTIHRLCMQFFLGDGSIRILQTSANTIAIRKAGVAEFTILTEKEGIRCRHLDRLAYGRQLSSIIDDCPDAFSCLTRLKLENLRLGESDFPKIFRLCKRLEFLHLDNCDMGFRSLLDVEHPRLRELEILRSDFERVGLNWLPELTTLTFSKWMSLDDPLSFGYVPLLHTVSIRNAARSWHKMLKLSEFLGKATVSNLHLGFESEKIWVKPEGPRELSQVFSKLKLVNLAAISKECNLAWTMFVLQGAPSLEELCIRVCDCLGIRNKDKRKMLAYSEERKDAGAKWEASDFKHRNLSVLRIFGFQSEDKFFDYARAVMEAAVNLKDIYLHENPACKVQCRYIRRQKSHTYLWSIMEKISVRSSLGMHMRPLLRLHFLF